MFILKHIYGVHPQAISTTKSKNGTDPNDYCLLYNLIDGKLFTHIYLVNISGFLNNWFHLFLLLLFLPKKAGRLTQAEGYKEICNKEKRPSMSSADCDKDKDFYVWMISLKANFFTCL